jgi:hypothetical protein
MALSPATVFEVRTTGAATNGGGFVAGATGTDLSQQDAPAIAVTDAVANGTTTITSATANFGATHPGNVIYLVGGTGPLAATRRQVVSVTNSTTIVVDATVATGTGITLNLGGALDGPTTLAASMVGSNKAFIKSGNYDSAALITFGQSAVTPSNTVPFTTIIGYNATRGDITPWTSNQANRPVIRTTTLNASVLSFTNLGWRIENLQVAPSGVATLGTGIATPGGAQIVNCKVSSFSTAGIVSASSGSGEIFYCEVTGGTAGNGISCSAGFNLIAGCWSHDHSGNTTGILSGASGTLIGNVVSNCVGATADGINISGGCYVLNNTVYKPGRHALVFTTTGVKVTMIRGNLFAEYVGYGINGSAAAIAADPLWDGNAFYPAGATGNRLNIDDVATNAINGVAPYTNVKDVILSADPFVAKASNDFRLNSTAGGGAACRGFGAFTSWPGLTIAGYQDMGAIQHQDAGGGGGGGGRGSVAIVVGTIIG